GAAITALEHDLAARVEELVAMRWLGHRSYNTDVRIGRQVTTSSCRTSARIAVPRGGSEARPWDSRATTTTTSHRPCAAHATAQPLSYSSWRRHQTPVSLRPLGARSSHWY